MLNESAKEEFRNVAEVEASVGDDGIRDSYLNLPNFISFTQFLGWMIVQDMYSAAFVGLVASGATDWSSNKDQSRTSVSSHFVEVPHINQQNTWDCGLACTLMVLQALGVCDYTIQELVDIYCTTRQS
ncbi:guanylyl cyclase 1 [Perilla frutescens var. hirtella]|nr:guanylyl cyclase 1 [Perilla frutescens var. hirtella]